MGTYRGDLLERGNGRPGLGRGGKGALQDYQGKIAKLPKPDISKLFAKFLERPHLDLSASSEGPLRPTWRHQKFLGGGGVEETARWGKEGKEWEGGREGGRKGGKGRNNLGGRGEKDGVFTKKRGKEKRPARRKTSLGGLKKGLERKGRKAAWTQRGRWEATSEYH